MWLTATGECGAPGTSGAPATRPASPVLVGPNPAAGLRRQAGGGTQAAAAARTASGGSSRTASGGGGKPGARRAKPTRQQLLDRLLQTQERASAALASSRPGSPPTDVVELQMSSLERAFAQLGDAARRAEREQCEAAYRGTNQWAPPVPSVPAAPGMPERFRSMLEESSSYQTLPLQPPGRASLRRTASSLLMRNDWRER